MHYKKVTQSATLSSPFALGVTTATHCSRVCLNKLFTSTHTYFQILKLTLCMGELCSHELLRFQVLSV